MSDHKLTLGAGALGAGMAMALGVQSLPLGLAIAAIGGWAVASARRVRMK